MKKFNLITCIFLLVCICFSFFAVSMINNKREIQFEHYSDYEKSFVQSRTDLESIDEQYESSIKTDIHLFSDKQSCLDYKQLSHEQMAALAGINFNEKVVLIISLESEDGMAVAPYISGVKISGNKLSVRTNVIGFDNGNEKSVIDIISLERDDISLDGNIIVDVVNGQSEVIYNEICVIE